MMDEQPLRAIETRYKGYRFRSRLEARWAVFFDALGLRWQYEPEGFELASGRYLPDFLVDYEGRCKKERHGIWFECKGSLAAVTSDEWAKMLEFDEKAGLMILDGPPDLRMYLGASEICHPNPHQKPDDLSIENIPRPFMAQSHAYDLKRAGYALWCPKGRLWWDEHDNFFCPTSYFDCGDLILENAVVAAKSARFDDNDSIVRRGGDWVLTPSHHRGLY
jgi:hypothetical protein